MGGVVAEADTVDLDQGVRASSGGTSAWLRLSHAPFSTERPPVRTAAAGPACPWPATRKGGVGRSPWPIRNRRRRVRLAAFADGPDQRLAAAHVAGGEHLAHVGGVGAGESVGRIAARVALDAAKASAPSHRADEAHGAAPGRRQVLRSLPARPLAVGHDAHLRSGSALFLLPTNSLVAMANCAAAPLRGWSWCAACISQYGQVSGLFSSRAAWASARTGDAGRAMAVAGAHAVAAGVAAADHDHACRVALIWPLSLSPATTLFCCGGTPWRSGCRPGRGPAPAGRGWFSAPPVSSTASNSAFSCSALMVLGPGVVGAPCCPGADPPARRCRSRPRPASARCGGRCGSSPS